MSEEHAVPGTGLEENSKQDVVDRERENETLISNKEGGSEYEDSCTGGVPAFTQDRYITDLGEATETAVVAEVVSEDTDGEPLLGFPSPVALVDKLGSSPIIAAVLHNAEEIIEAIETELMLTRKRKGEPVSLSSMSDEKKDGSDGNMQETRAIRSIITRRRITEREALEEDIPLKKKRQEDATPKPMNKFWKKDEETQTETSSDEGKDIIKGARKKPGASKKMKKKEQVRNNDFDEEREVFCDKPKSHHRTAIKPRRNEEKVRNGSSSMDKKEQLALEKYGHLAASAAGALAFELLAEIEVARFKTSNVQGRLSGLQNKNVIKLREITHSLVYRAEAVGDPLYLKMRSNELSKQLAEAIAKVESQKKELRTANKLLKGSQACNGCAAPPKRQATRHGARNIAPNQKGTLRAQDKRT